MLEIKGKCGIIAKIILDSVSESGVRITTFELTYQRMIHAELLTHRRFSRNAASSRAIPFKKMQEQLTARPVRFGAANPGMQDKGCEYSGLVTYSQDPYTRVTKTAEEAWEDTKNSALNMSKAYYEAGFHKQVYNRLTEPFQMMKTVLTTTEFSNFEWLRNDIAADPSLEELAKCMVKARNESQPIQIRFGDWHLPYVSSSLEDIADYLVQVFWMEEDDEMSAITLETAIKVSAARSAAISFRNTDYHLAKCIEVYDRLVGDERKHASALEHQATPIQPFQYEFETITGNACTIKHINSPEKSHTWEPGISHVDRDGNLWSGNFRGWLQYRKLINGEDHNYE